jgi:hypothetical protein
VPWPWVTRKKVRWNVTWIYYSSSVHVIDVQFKKKFPVMVSQNSSLLSIFRFIMREFSAIHIIKIYSFISMQSITDRQFCIKCCLFHGTETERMMRLSMTFTGTHYGFVRSIVAFLTLTLFILVRHTSQYYRMIWLHRPVWLKSIFTYMWCLKFFTFRSINDHLQKVNNNTWGNYYYIIIVHQVQSCPKFY